MQMELEETTKERERAFARFTDIVEAHHTALLALGLLATLPDADELLAAHIKLLAAGARGEVSFADMVGPSERRIEIAKIQREQGYTTLRGVTLVAMCGAFEYLLKAVLVDQAAYDPGRASDLLLRSKIKLPAAEVIGRTPTEQWYAVAERLFESLAEGFPRAYERSVKMLLDYVHLPLGKIQQDEIQAALTQGEAQKFNEAFLIRNCLVHNGGRVSSILAHHSGLQRGSLITLDKRKGVELMQPIKKFAEQVNFLHLI